jgi:hypothetical protein
MSDLGRRFNHVLGQRLGVQVVRGNRRPVKLSEGWFVRFFYFSDLLSQALQVPGDLVECGVASGSGLAMLASISRAMAGGDGRHVWGFDAWSGLPAPTEADLAHEDSIAEAGLFGHASIRRVTDELTAYGWTETSLAETVRLVPGYFHQTLPRFDRPIAFLHIDADLYASYQCALTNLWPKVQPGGIVAFDEYEQADIWPGARQAVDEFIEELPAGAASLHEDQRSGKWWMKKT